MHPLMDRNAVAVTTYRRANGSQAQVSRPRVVRAPKVFPLAKTPSQTARRAANERSTMEWYVMWCDRQHGTGSETRSEAQRTTREIFARAERPVIVSMLRDARLRRREG